MKRPGKTRSAKPAVPENPPAVAYEPERRLLEAAGREGRDGKAALRELAHLYKTAGHLEGCERFLAQLEPLLATRQERGEFFFMRGQLMEKRGDYAEAARNYREALRHKPRERDLWYFMHNNLGFSLNELGQFRQAESILRRALAINPTHANAYKNLGLCQRGRGRIAEAARWFIAATRVNPADPRSLAHLEELFETHYETLDSEPDVSRALETCRVAVAHAGEAGRYQAWQRRRRN